MTTWAASSTLGLAWHALDVAEALAHLGTDADPGLTADEARGRLARVGANRIAEHSETPLLRLALDQFTSLVVLLLLAAAAIAWALAERAEALAILVALLLNAAIGFGSEWRAAFTRTAPVGRRSPRARQAGRSRHSSPERRAIAKGWGAAKSLGRSRPSRAGSPGPPPGKNDTKSLNFGLGIGIASFPAEGTSPQRMR